MSAAHDPGFKTTWSRREPYMLDELAAVIPLPAGECRRLPARSAQKAGRNCYLFRACMGWAGSAANLDFAALPTAIAANAKHFTDHPAGPLSYGDIQALAKSVERYRRQWSAQGKFYGKRQGDAVQQGLYT